MFEFEVLPSARLLAHLEDQVLQLIGKLPATIFEPTLDALGDLGLALATLPMARWSGNLEALARLIGGHWSWPEATAAVEIAIQRKLLIPVAPGSKDFRPAEVGHFLWLAARRVARTDDQDGLLDHRLRGLLTDVFAMAAALAEDDASIGLVQSFLTAPGPLEDLLFLGHELAMRALAWGARTDPETHLALVRQAFEWTTAGAPDDHEEVAIALLAAEAWSGPLTDEVRITAKERLETAISEMAADDELLHHPRVADAIDVDLAILVAGSGGDADLLEPWFEGLGQVHAFRVGKAIARVLPPSEAKNTLLTWAANRAMKERDVEALSVLGALVEPLANSVGIVHGIFKLLLEHPDDDDLTATAWGACRAIAHWKTCPELTIHLVSRLVLSPIPAQVRIAAAGVLARHPQHLGQSRQVLLEGLEECLDSEDPAIRAAGAGGLLFLGSEEPRAAAMVVGLVTDGVPPELFAEAFASGLRATPTQAEGLEQMWQHFADRPDIHSALTQMIGALAQTCMLEHGLGPFFMDEPLEPDTRHRLLAYLLERTHDFDHPETALSAAVHAAWISRVAGGDPSLGIALRSIRNQVTDPEQRELATLALGALGLGEDIHGLVDEAAHGGPDVSAAAARAAMVAIDTRSDTDDLDELVPLLDRRARQPGPQQDPVRALLRHLATVPLAAAIAAPSPEPKK